jgi:hypothetical protein
MIFLGGVVAGFRPINTVWSVPLELFAGIRLANLIWMASCSFPGDPLVGLPIVVIGMDTVPYALPIALAMSGFAAIEIGGKRKLVESPEE